MSALIVGLRRKHDVPRVATAPAPAQVAVPAMPTPAPAPPVEIALDPAGAAPAPTRRSAPDEAERGPSRKLAQDEGAPPRRAQDEVARQRASDEAAPRHRHEKRHHEHRVASHRERTAPRHGSRARESRKVATAGDHNAARAAYARGNVLLLTGNAAGAAAAYEEAVRLAPSDPGGYRGLGLAYEKQGRINDAIAALVSYLKLSRHAHDREVIARRLHRLTHPSSN